MIAFIAKRLNDKQGTGQVSRPAIVIATAGVAVGLMVMILTVCITLGFKTEIHDMVRNTAGDLRLYNSPVIGVEGQG
ncbi:MAG: ABC transporter permease, partial [Bacteroidaceae bacterium]|nr:ABC transporter permease [Bacteroidaceae bacterium]